jgi:hypothetical protein
MDRRKTKSVRLKKYESVYNEYIKNKSRSPENKTVREPRIVKPIIADTKSRKKEEKAVDSGKKKKKLTEYQKFVKEESKKDKYKGLKPDERMAKIAKAWKKRQK